MLVKNRIWRDALKVIGNGNSLLSKSPSQYSRNWPTYYSKAKGCKIWDLKKREYLDFGTMGIGTNILGYSNPRIDSAVIKAIRNSNMSTLNCHEEYILANELLKLHDGMHKVKFTRSGGEANTLAVRLARAHTKKNKIIICGYHGWHDWYLAPNLKNKFALKNHLRKDLKIGGVPSFFKNSSMSVSYNDLDNLEKIIKKNPDIAAIIMEVKRFEDPKEGYLKKIRELCNKKNIVLIFDECSSGFRETYGGIYKKYKVRPDILMLGKALGNGFAINAVLGKNKIFNHCKDTFISSTFWTERSGFVAGLATLKEMKRINSWNIICDISLNLKNKLKNLMPYNKGEVINEGIIPFINIKFKNKNLKNKYIEKMVDKKILTSDKIYISTSHSKKYVNYFLKMFKEVINSI